MVALILIGTFEFQAELLLCEWMDWSSKSTQWFTIVFVDCFFGLEPQSSCNPLNEPEQKGLAWMIIGIKKLLIGLAKLDEVRDFNIQFCSRALSSSSEFSRRPEVVSPVLNRVVASAPLGLASNKHQR